VNRYRVLLPIRIGTREQKPGEAGFAQGEEFETDLSVEEEADALKSGAIEIVPREYKVVGTSFVFDTPPGETFIAAIPRGQEELLLGYHLERVASKSKAKADKGA